MLPKSSYFISSDQLSVSIICYVISETTSSLKTPEGHDYMFAHYHPGILPDTKNTTVNAGDTQSRRVKGREMPRYSAHKENSTFQYKPLCRSALPENTPKF